LLECERYDVANNFWSSIAPLAEYAYSMNLIQVDRQFIYVVGG